MHWAFIYYAPGTGRAADRVTVDRDGMRVDLIPVASEKLVAEAARDAVADGAKLIELCGVFGPRGMTAVLDSVGTDVAVGGVVFGSESADNLARLIA